MSSGNNLLGDDKYTEYGNDHDYRLKYNSSSNRWEIVDPSGNVLLHVTDAGTTGNLGVTGNLAVSGATTLSGALTASITDSGTNNVIQGPAWFHKSSGAPASGLGISIILGADNASHSPIGAAELHGYLTTVTAGSEVGAYKIRLIYNGANQDAFTITPGTNTTTITSGQTTLNCFNTVATTVNAFGAATTLNLGAATGTTTVANTLSVTGAGATGYKQLIVGTDTTAASCGLHINAAANQNKAVTWAAAGTIKWYLYNPASSNNLVFNDGVNGDVFTIAQGGVVTIRGGTVTPSTNTTWNLWNTVATTINFGGAATTLAMGAGASATATLSFTTAINLNTAAIASNQTTVALLNVTPTTINFGSAADINMGGSAKTVTIQGALAIAGSKTVTLGEATNWVLGTSSGSKMGTSASQKWAVWNATPIVQPSSTGETAGYTGGGGTALTHSDTFTGNVGTKAYTLNDLVKHFKNIGLIAAS